MASQSLLPPNATELERLAAETLAQIERVPVPLRDLWNPDTCPVELLPYLAWAFSVDRWDSSWSEGTKRRVISGSYFLHAHKGTIGALRRVVEPLGYIVDITEWWQANPQAIPGTFEINIGLRSRGLTESLYGLLIRLIDDAKPVSRHLERLTVSIECAGNVHVGAASVDGQETTVYPYTVADIGNSGLLYLASLVQDVTSTTIYPQGWQDESALARLTADGAQRVTEAGYLRTVEY